ncbi:MAG: CvpA family protein [Bacteriovoracaceae bacterium]|nr:CvpA family protein [Bacteriovoracaceae bacterium]HNR52132.1 CvpA family protein [Deltaproteobacteria bacterium]HPX50471.1 CvpA family protein [Deltaproteobacteria bacterium]HQA72515.1 CvpA family protein [Deltaproteobacteria bacterium]HRT46286.1 CvpA family protein [Desulfomonilia bacterium]
MNALDYLSILLCAVFLALGAYQGLLRSVSSLAALLTGLYSAKKAEPVLSKLLAAVHAPNPKGVLGYLLVFFLIFFSIKILLFFIQKMLRASPISVLDRLLGAFLGLAKGVVIAVFVCTVLQLALPRNSAILVNSELLPYSNKIVSTAGGFIPNGVRGHLGRT